jgi:hypothetical protein
VQTVQKQWDRSARTVTVPTSTYAQTVCILRTNHFMKLCCLVNPFYKCDACSLHLCMKCALDMGRSINTCEGHPLNFSKFNSGQKGVWTCEKTSIALDAKAFGPSLPGVHFVVA